MSLPTDRQERKDIPLARGVLDYFPAGLAGVAQCSVAGNAQHNPDSPDIVWARSKSNDHADCIMRHLVERDEVDTDGIPHVYKVAWRALALAQEYAEARGAKPGKASRFEDDVFAGVAEEDKSAAENIWVPQVGDEVLWHMRGDDYANSGLFRILGVPGHESKYDYALAYADTGASAVHAFRDELTLVKRGGQ